MTSPFRVVIGYDFSYQAKMALERAVWLVSGFETAEAHVVAAIDKRHHDKHAPQVSTTYEGTEELRTRVQADAHALLARTAPRSVKLFVHTRIGDAADAILEVAAEVHADMVLVGTHSRKGVVRMVLGSVSGRVVREARCPVMVVRDTYYNFDEPGFGPEPPCPKCVRRRHETGGEMWWCEYHDHQPPYESPLRTAHRHDPETSHRFAWPYAR